METASKTGSTIQNPYSENKHKSIRVHITHEYFAMTCQSLTNRGQKCCTQHQARLPIHKMVLFHVLLEKFPVEVTSDGVIDKALGQFCLSTCLILENHIIIPPEQIRGQSSLSNSINYTLIKGTAQPRQKKKKSKRGNNYITFSSH